MQSPPQNPPPVQSPLFPTIPENGAEKTPTPIQKPRSQTYQDIKLVLRNKPTTVYCTSCKRNVVSNLRVKRSSLLHLVRLIHSRYYIALLFVLFIMLAIWMIDELEDKRPLMLVGFATLCICTGIIAYCIYLISFFHACPLCGMSLGKQGHTVSRQGPAVMSIWSVCWLHFDSIVIKIRRGTMESEKRFVPTADSEGSTKKIHVECILGF